MLDVARCDGYQRGLASMVYKFFDKKYSGSGGNTHVNNKVEQNQRPLDMQTNCYTSQLF